MSINELLYISFIIYLMIMTFATLFKFKMLYMLAGLLWFIPVIQIDDIFITLVSAIMIIIHFILGLYEPKESEF